MSERTLIAMSGNDEPLVVLESFDAVMDALRAAEQGAGWPRLTVYYGHGPVAVNPARIDYVLPSS